MKVRRVRGKGCGDRFTVVRLERERTPTNCGLCREERKRAQVGERMRAFRERRRAAGG